MRFFPTGMSIVLHSFLRRFWLFWAAVAIVATFAIVWFMQFSLPQSRSAKIQRAMAEQRWVDAELLARSWGESYPKDMDAQIALGDVLQRLGSNAEAVEIYRRVPDEAGQHRMTAQLGIVSIFLRQGRLDEAESILRTVKLDPSHTDIANGLSVTLLSLSGRQWESIPYLQRTLNKVGDRLMTLIYLANPDEMPAPPEEVFAKMLRVRDPLGLHGCARIAASVGRKEQALKLVRECLSMRSNFVEAQITLGTLLIDSGNEAEFEDWLAKLPGTADEHPMIWFLRGRRAQDRDHRQEAIRCYWEVLRRQPNNDRATYQLGQLLSAEACIDDGRVFSDRAKRLQRLIELSVKLYEQRGAKQEIVECAQLTHELGRLRECQAWCEELKAISADDSTSVQLIKTFGTDLRDDLPWLQPEADLASRFDLSSYPLPKRNSPGREAQPHARSQNSEQSRIAFADDSLRVGLDFVYFNGDDPSTTGKRMFEFTGGGVAAIDYDLDGWCDVYFTQGTTWPPQQSNHQYLDAMFRNVAGQRMQNVAAHVGIQDAGYGQGVSVNDYDNDGFSDIYVANIDGNRLYRNQGDGTFSDVTPSSGIGTHSDWTTSCLVADLNGDSLPDVFDVCYLKGDDVFLRICEGSDGIPSSCPPEIFPAAPDHVYMNLGDGTFREVTHDWGFDVPNGDGLGIIAGDFDDSGTISLFVGNDGRANFFFVPETTTGQVRWNEIGVVSGLAYDDAGAAQACMGIAAGDANNDGRLDLFVTNFYNESNTLYINLGSRTFTDRSRSTGIRDASWSMLGFGTQFVDADHDGWEDIILVNGHVDDFTHKQIPYKMRPQYFQNRKTRFSERLGKDLGPFFDEPRLGRGLARLDWNRDGLNDVAISYIGDPAALLTNRTQKAGGRIGLKLVGTTRSRDAIGTRVTVRTGDNQLTRQLTGGDGYQASNERRLEFGLGEHPDHVEVEIRWMGGAIETLKVELIDQEYIAIEGRGELLRLNAE